MRGFLVAAAIVALSVVPTQATACNGVAAFGHCGVVQQGFAVQSFAVPHQVAFAPQPRVFVAAAHPAFVQQRVFVANAGANVVNVRGASVAAAPGQRIDVRARGNRVRVRVR